MKYLINNLIPYAIAALVSGLVVHYGLKDKIALTEAALQSAFNEGVEHGTCLAIKGRVSAEEMDKCWEMKDD